MHLLADWPNPLGVPWIIRRHSLRWWKSGRHDLIVIGAAWLAATIVADHVFFDGIHLRRITTFVQGWPLWSTEWMSAALDACWQWLRQWRLGPGN